MIDWKSLSAKLGRALALDDKLEHLMLIFYEWSPLRPSGYFKTLEAALWKKPDANTLAVIEQDWRVIQQLEIEGRRAEVSESSDAVTWSGDKGTGSRLDLKSMVVEAAVRRVDYRSMTVRQPPPAGTRARDPELEFENVMRAKLRSIEGKTITDVARMIGTTVGRDKSASRSRHDQTARGTESARVGTEISSASASNSRLSRSIDGDGLLSRCRFRAFIHEELQYETWPDSDLLGRLNRILVVPIQRSKGQDQGEGSCRGRSSGRHRSLIWSRSASSGSATARQLLRPSTANCLRRRRRSTSTCGPRRGTREIAIWRPAGST